MTALLLQLELNFTNFGLKCLSQLLIHKRECRGARQIAHIDAI
jgi:hypothetical protein